MIWHIILSGNIAHSGQTRFQLKSTVNRWLRKCRFVVYLFLPRVISQRFLSYRSAINCHLYYAKQGNTKYGKVWRRGQLLRNSVLLVECGFGSWWPCGLDKVVGSTRTDIADRPTDGKAERIAALICRVIQHMPISTQPRNKQQPLDSCGKWLRSGCRAVAACRNRRFLSHGNGTGVCENRWLSGVIVSFAHRPLK